MAGFSYAAMCTLYDRLAECENGEHVELYRHLDDVVNGYDLELADGFDGCLVDNGLYYSVDGMWCVAVYECYENTNNSVYLVIRGDDVRAWTAIENEFYERKEAYEHECMMMDLYPELEREF